MSNKTNEVMTNDEMIELLMKPEYMATIIAQEPGYIRNSLARSADDKQIDGSFGALVQQSIGIAEVSKQQEAGNSNVISFFRKR